MIQIDTVTATTPDFRAGQTTARRMAAAYCPPNWALIKSTQNPEFIAGLRFEWDDLSVFGRRTPSEIAKLAQARLDNS